MKYLKKIIDYGAQLFSDEEDPELPAYDPVHIGAMLVLVFFSLSIVFWLLWSLLVFGGGIQKKVIPFLQVLLTSKTAADFGYEGYPYAMGIFDGWITNLAALFFFIAVVAAGWYVYTKDAGMPRK